MLKQIFTVLVILCGVNWLHAQDSIKVAKDSARTAQDSARRARRSYDSTLFSDNNKLTTTDYLISLEKAFQTFIRIHRSYAIQKHYIKQISSREVLVNDRLLPVGRSYKESVERLLS